MPGLIADLKRSITDYKSELESMARKALSINRSVCDLDEVIDSIRASTQIQERKIASLDDLGRRIEQFAENAARIDSAVADLINKRKDEFYKEHGHLKPECEKGGWEKLCDIVASAPDWCAKHWKELLITAVVVLCTVLAVVAIIATGGMALVPMLAAGLTALGVGSGTALTVATVVSLSVAAIALVSSVGSAALNIIDTWHDMSGNPTFKAWQNTMNWISLFSNLGYGVGAIYSSLKGISNAGLRAYSNSFRNNSVFKDAIRNAGNYPLSPQANSSVFWTGMANDGGEAVAQNFIRSNGGSTLESLLGATRPATDVGWRQASASFAMNSSGQVKTLIGSSPWAGSVWNTTEKILLNINPKVTGITEIMRQGLEYIPRTFGMNGSLWAGLSSMLGGLSSQTGNVAQ
jgi:hypothetical protein